MFHIGQALVVAAVPCHAWQQAVAAIRFGEGIGSCQQRASGPGVANIWSPNNGFLIFANSICRPGIA